MPNNERHITCSREPRENKPIFKTKKFALILSLLLITTLLYQIKPTYSRTLHVPTEYSTIQAAINAAVAGDTIQVAPRTYYEHVDVNKSLTIIGENPQTTIVDGTANDVVFYLQASNIIITGFTIRNAGDNYSAIVSERELVANDYHQIRNNIITTSGYGVYLTKSNYNTIFNNTFINNAFEGIHLSSSTNTNITRNTITESAYGIKLMYSLNNIIKENTISQTSFAIHLTSTSTGNTIRRNILYGKTAGVYSSSDTTTVDRNTIIDGSSGIYFYNCRYGSIYYNTITNSSYGIRLYWTTAATSTHNINNNKIVNADWAIELVNSFSNTFTGNWLQQNTYGIYMSYSGSNNIYHNNFIQNNMQAYSGTGTGNLWDNGYPSGGNYWSDYTGADLKSGPNQNQPGSDGIGDTAYRIYPVGYDNYPLMTTWSEHDITIQSVTPSTNEANAGAIVNITVIVKNNANISTSETFNVTAKYNSTIIGTQTVNNLAKGLTAIKTFQWNTTGVASGNYTISAQASTVPDELNTDNNNYTDGTIKIKIPIIGDIDGNGTINNQDLILLNQAYGSTASDTIPPWNPEADLNKDYIVDAKDLLLLGQNYGNTA